MNRLDPVRSDAAYLAAFGAEPGLRERLEDALDTAIEIRNFEIGLYWKRAAYFWTLIGAAFAGLVALLAKDNGSPPEALVFLVACVGFLLSFAWYLVNRGSKFWQENWETQVEILEAAVHRPLFATTIAHEEFANAGHWDAFPMSVTKINHLVSEAVCWAWILAVVRSILILLLGSLPAWVEAAGLIIIGTGTFWVMILLREARSSQEAPRALNLRRRVRD